MEELELDRILSIISELNEAGTRFISFTGGEPLLREDLGEIINKATSFGIRVYVNSNGKLVPDRIDILKNASLIKISLDGPKLINDRIRGKGNFDEAIKALDLLKKTGVNVEINAVISKVNINHISEIINIAKGLNVGVSFQPATLSVFGEDIKNPISATAEEYRDVIKFLIDQKEGGSQTILNSLTSLKHLHSWPALKKLPCAAGLLSCRIEPDGKLFACGWKPVIDEKNGLDLKKYSLNRAFEMIEAPECNGCWASAVVEFNLLMSFNPNACFNFLKEKAL